jgi:ComF family protein
MTGLQTPSRIDAANISCRICQHEHPPFERAVAYGTYDGALRDLIHLLKFDHVRPASSVLGHLLADSIAALDPSLPAGPIAVVPVPLHAHKQAHRGFNQAEVIARAALKDLRDRQPGSHERYVLSTNTLIRSRETGSQIGLTRHQRRQNLRGAFAIKDATPIVNRDVLVVDDVYTTGSTASECARVLRRAGAARVWVATVARTLKVSSSTLIEDFSPAEGQERNENEEDSRLTIAVHG